MQKDNYQKLSQGMNNPVGFLQGVFLNCEKKDATLSFAMVNKKGKPAANPPTTPIVFRFMIRRELTQRGEAIIGAVILFRGLGMDPKFI